MLLELVSGDQKPQAQRAPCRACREFTPPQAGGLPDVGILLGCPDEAPQSLYTYMVDVLPAPEDSVRAPTEFILGARGLKNMLQGYLDPPTSPCNAWGPDTSISH